jgi:hypothetical protein
MVNALNAGTFQEVVEYLTAKLAGAPDVNVGEWQAIQGPIPQAMTIEVEDVSFSLHVDENVGEWQKEVRPNLPWAEKHFLERISKIPWNPPPSHVDWPFAQKDNEEHRPGGKFSHTYPERFWPKYANDMAFPRMGIRYSYGDLDDVIWLLKTRPGTRQAFLPIWFPEDTGSVENQRVPCSLGYHFMVRNGTMKCVYYIRSCDFYRHFRDDVYMAGRLLQYVAEKSNNKVGQLVMHMSSLHIFSVERGKIGMEHHDFITQQLSKQSW